MPCRRGEITGTAQFYQALKQMTARRANSASDQQSRKSLVAEVILMMPFDPSVSSMEVALAAWLRLRAGENAPDNGNGLDDAYLRRMADFTLSLL